VRDNLRLDELLRRNMHGCVCYRLSIAENIFRHSSGCDGFVCIVHVVDVCNIGNIRDVGNVPDVGDIYYP
jgi:hypothetical protein